MASETKPGPSSFSLCESGLPLLVLIIAMEYQKEYNIINMDTDSYLGCYGMHGDIRFHSDYPTPSRPNYIKLVRYLFFG